MTSNSQRDSKVVVIGWDGATWDLLDPWLAEGKMPNLAAFLEAGVRGPLRSTVPPFTYPAWTSFLTGKNPGRHGVFDFTERVPGSREIQFVNARRVRSKTIWRLLSDAGRRVACMGVPVSYPPQPINGVLLCGFDAPGSGSRTDSSSVYPPEILAEIRANVGDYVTSANIMPLMSEEKYEEALERILEVMELKGRTARYLLDKEEWDVFMVLFGESDLVGHHFWRFTDPRSPLYTETGSARVRNAIYEVYKRLDDMLPMLLEAAPADSTVLLVSDHGFGGSGDRVIYMNKWLAEQGFLSFAGTGASGGLGFRLVNKAKYWGLRFLPPAVKTWIFRRRQAIANKMESYLRFDGIDWSKTQAFSEELPYLQTIWINVKGREPDGIVEPGEQYAAVVDDLRRRLMDWVDPETGEKVVEEIVHRDEVYDGPFKDRSPDLIVRTHHPDGYAYQGRSTRQSSPAASIERVSLDAPGAMKFFAAKSGSHRDLGIFAGRGPLLGDGGARVTGARLMDIAPTVLYLLGEPIPRDMDGEVLQQALAPEALESSAPVYGESDSQSLGSELPTYSKDDEAVISERLRGLGYMD